MLDTMYVIPPRLNEDDMYRMVQSYTVVAVLAANCGPCKTCDKPMARLDVVQHNWHNGYAYDMHFDFLATHADGSPPCGGQYVNGVKPKCPSCKRYGTIATEQQAYGESTKCSACGYLHWYPIGD